MIGEHALAQPCAVVDVTASAHGLGVCVIAVIAPVLEDVLRDPLL